MQSGVGEDGPLGQPKQAPSGLQSVKLLGPIKGSWGGRLGAGHGSQPPCDRPVLWGLVEASLAQGHRTWLSRYRILFQHFKDIISLYFLKVSCSSYCFSFECSVLSFLWLQLYFPFYCLLSFTVKYLVMIHSASF